MNPRWLAPVRANISEATNNFQASYISVLPTKAGADLRDGDATATTPPTSHPPSAPAYALVGSAWDGSYGYASCAQMLDANFETLGDAIFVDFSPVYASLGRLLPWNATHTAVVAYSTGVAYFVPGCVWGVFIHGGGGEQTRRRRGNCVSFH